MITHGLHRRTFWRAALRPAFARRRSARLSRRGVALIITLWVVVIMTVMAYSMLHEANLSVDLTRNFRSRFYAMVLARAGLGRATVDLHNDLIIDVHNRAEQPIIDAKGDPWAREDEEYTEVEMPHGTYTVRVIDEDRFLPIGNQPQTRPLKMMLEVLGMDDEEEAENVAAAIKDYVDPDDAPSLQEAEHHYENRAYERLISEELRLSKNEVVHYVNKNDRINTVEELQQIYGVTDDLYFGSAWGREEDDRLKWRRPRYYDRLDMPRDYRPGLRDLVTPFPVPTINVNTMAPEVAHALFSIASNSVRKGEDAAKNLVTKRPEPRRGRRPDNDEAMNNFAELPNVGVDLSAANGARAGAALSARSHFFRITSVGEVDGVIYTIRAVVHREWDVVARDESKLDRDQGRQRRSRDEDAELAESSALRVYRWSEY